MMRSVSINAKVMVTCLNKDSRKRLGDEGEAIASQYLISLGYHIKNKQWRCRSGEIDLIAMDQDVWVFIEVRTRHISNHYGKAKESITYHKQRKVREIAQYYMYVHQLIDPKIRFDCVSVEWYPAMKDPQIELVQGAF
jgi:putative endonuclease